jgi:penicillin-binding protein 2
MNKWRLHHRVLAVVASAALVWAPVITAATTATTAKTAKKATKKHASSRWGVPTYADSTEGDVTQYDDQVVREAAIEALGRYNGSVVAIDPNNGRVLSVVNQKLAFSPGFIPCSTIKTVIALAALQEGTVTQDSMIQVGRRRFMNLTEAMAHSNNKFFEELGRRMGFDTVIKYAQMLGLGEKAGYDIPEEQAGVLPSSPPEYGGVARMSSFGQGIQITPFELGSLVSAYANGGTMYYLQYPRTPQDIEEFQPRVKRQLQIEAQLPEIRDGMLAAVLYGTAQRSWDYEGDQPLGKTGSCSDSSSRIGWFVTYADQVHPRIVLVVLMRGHSHADQGPIAAGIAGHIYRRLREENYLSAENPTPNYSSESTAAGPNR